MSPFRNELLTREAGIALAGFAREVDPWLRIEAGAASRLAGSRS